jgi:hypothetical protein
VCLCDALDALLQETGRGRGGEARSLGASRDGARISPRTASGCSS